MKIARILKLILILLLGCCTVTTLTAQVVINNGDCNLDINIPDNNCVQVSIPITNAPGTQLGQNVFLEEVQLIIEHGWRNDLQVTLIAPDGNTAVRLINERGGSSNHFGLPSDTSCAVPFILANTPCSTDSVKNIASSTETIGTFIPEEPFSNFYLPTPFDPNGNWTLEVCDDKFGDIGSLEFAELSFIPLGCPAPTNLEAFNVRAETIDLGWENTGQCNNIVVEYGPEGFAPGNGTTAGAANSQVVVLTCLEEFDLLNLEQLTTYDIYVRQICNGFNYAYNSCKVTATTDCILPPVTLLENFDNQISCGSNGGDCIDCPTLEGVWKNAVDDDIDWIINSGSTITSGTGPSSDVDVNGQYIYLESSSSCRPAKDAVLLSNCIEVAASTGICHMSFFYHMFGININALRLEITTDGNNWSPIWAATGSQKNEWIRQYINLSAYDGMVVQFRFRGTSAAVNFRGDIGLDRISFYGSQLKASDTFYADADNDGFGNPLDSLAVCFAAQPAGYVPNKLDCDDTNPTINPNATEIPCNGIDENCNGNADDVLIFNPTFSVAPICSGDLAIISVDGSNDGQIYWFENSTDNVPIDSGVIFSTPILTDTTTYFFRETKIFATQTCESNLVPVEIIVHPQPTITNASGDQSICQNTNFDLTTLIIQDANNATDSILFFSNDSYANNARITNPIVAISSDSTFYIQAKASAGCTDEISVFFSKQPTPSVSITQGDTLKLCFQSSPQLLTATENSGGAGPFDFAWSTGAQGNEAIVFARGKNDFQMVEVTATSPANGCSATDQIVVHTLPSISTIEVTDIQEPSFCQEDGAILLSARDGQAPYNFAWSGAVSGLENSISTTNYTINNLELGAYTITVTDNFGCSKTLPQQVVNGPDFGIDAITDVTCFGLNDGTIILNVGGLVNPTYEWNDGTSVFSNNQNLAGLSGGVYSVVVDADNVAPCAIDSIIITEPDLLEISDKNAISPSCAGAVDGAIELVITGGTPSATGTYNFAWDNGIVNTGSPNNLAPNTYNVTVTDTKNCSASAQIIVEPTPVLTVTLNPVDPKCFGQDDGEIRATVSGGSPPYTYIWNDALNQTTASAFGLNAATYSLTVTDANGCQKIENATLNNPLPITAAVANITSPLCREISDGIVDLSVSGGTGIYRYSWSNGDTTVNLSNASAGIYAVTITDENNCTATIDSIDVPAPNLMELTFSNWQNPTCEGIDDGALTVEVSGGVAPYNYAWNNDATTANLNNLTANNYQVTVTDDNGCITKSDTVQLMATQLLSITDFLVIDSINCRGDDNGVVFFRARSEADGANNFTFEWRDSTTIVENTNGFWLSSDYTSLTKGNYEITIKDNLGCTLNTSFELTEPEFLFIDTVLVEPPSCFGESDGNVIASVIGGTAPFTFSWTLPNNRIVRTTDEILQNIDGGAYQLEIIDANNCVSPLYTFNVETSSPINLNIMDVKGVSCSAPENGLIDINASGGREGINFEWNNGLLTEDLTNLDAGVYTVTITDGAECTLVRSFDIQFEEDSLDVELIALDNASCENTTNGEISVKVNGGFGSYQYFWSNGTQVIDGDTTTLANLPAGNYSVSVVDENNDYLCVGYLPNLTLTPDGDISVDLDDFNNELACFGDADGAYLITPSGGNAPYDYLWSNGDTSQDVSNLAAGNYSLTITDAKGCTWSSGDLFPEILAPSNPFTIAPNAVTDSLCVGDDSGEIIIDVSGGTFPYNFDWNNGATTASIQNLTAGTYSLTATDENGCTVRLDTSIALKVEALQANLIVTDLTCFEDNSGFIEAKVTCGVPPYQYLWNTGDTTKNLINLVQGAYAVTITDANGAEMTDFASLRSPPPLQVDSTRIDLVNCEGFIRLDVSGGVSNSYNYTWRNETGTIISTSNSANGLAAGTYAVTVSDANNCQIILDDLVIGNGLLIDSVTTSSTFNKPSNRGTLKVDTVFGGMPPYNYLWFNDNNEIIGTNAAVSGVILGNYYVVITDQNGCELRQEQILDISDPITEITIVEGFNLYPNPTSGRSFIDLQFSERVDVSITLLDGIGKRIKNLEKRHIRQLVQEIDLSDQPSGIFYLKITVNDYPSFGEKLFHIKN